MKRIICLSFLFFLYSVLLSAQDTILVNVSTFDGNRKEVIRKEKKINYTGMIYPRIFEKTITGEFFNGLRLKDSILVLNFWDVHCAPCIAEMPGLNKLKNDYKNKPVAFLALSMDDPKVVSEKFIQNHRFELRQLFFDNELKKEQFYCAPGYPTTIIVDQHSKVFFILEGGGIENAGEEIYTKLSVELDKLLK